MIAIRKTLCIVALLGLLLASAASSVWAEGLTINVVHMGEWVGDYYRSEITNMTNRTMRYQLKANSYDNRFSYDLGTFEIEALGTRKQDFYLPFFDHGYFRCEDDEGDVLTGHPGRDGYKTYLQIAPYREQATTEQLDYFINGPREETEEETQPPVQFYGAALQQRAPGEGYFSKMVPEELPTDWRYYISFGTILISESTWRSLRPSVRTALREAVQVGGSLVYYSATNPNDIPFDPLAGEIEARMDNPLAEITIKGGAPFKSNSLSFPPNHGGYDFDDFYYGVDAAAGSLGGIVLATIFSLIVGPVNIIYCRRKKKIRMLMLTVPALSLAFCLMIVVYFIASQGANKRGGTYSVTLLDEASQGAVSYSHHLLRSGLYPLGGFSFDPETLLYAVTDTEFSESSAGFEFGSRQRLVSGLFRPQVNFHYWTVLPFRTPERLLYHPAERSIVNGFESDLSDVIVVDGEQILIAQGDVDAEGKIPLELHSTVTRRDSNMDGNGVLRILERELVDIDEQTSFREYSDEIAKAISGRQRFYIARMGNGFEATWPGVKISKGAGTHWLVGILNEAN